MGHGTTTLAAAAATPLYRSVIRRSYYLRSTGFLKAGHDKTTCGLKSDGHGRAYRERPGGRAGEAAGRAAERRRSNRTAREGFLPVPGEDGLGRRRRRRRPLRR